MNENYSLSPKDCLYIDDLLSHTDSLIKKTSYYFEMSNDDDVRALLEDLNILLSAQYEDLINMYEEAK